MLYRVMCLILLALGVDPGFPLVFAANRDEFFARPTALAGYWPKAPQVLGGRDLDKGGTWMGVTRGGRWAAVTNFRDGTRPGPGSRSRGELVARFLSGSQPAQAYARETSEAGGEYHGFNLLVADAEGAHYVSNRGGRPLALDPGIYGLSNHLLDTPWPKVERGKRMLEGVLGAGEEELSENLLGVLADRGLAEDRALPQTGVSRDWERALSSVFISAPGYGTRASTVLLIGRDGGAHFRERSFGPDGELIDDRRFRFILDPKS